MASDPVSLYRNWTTDDTTKVYSGSNIFPEITSVIGGTDWSQENFIFVEWNSSRDGQGTSYAPGQTFPSSPRIFYAIYSAKDDLIISYNNSTITSLSKSGIVVLDTAGKLVNNNITIEYTKPGGSSGGGDFTGLVQRTITSAFDSAITTVGAYTFYNCSNLATVSFPNCTTIGSSAFFNCSNLTTVLFSSCTSIGTYAFTICDKLTTISFPNCTSIGTYAFSGCYSLATASFPSCTSIGMRAFYNCVSLTTISFPNCTYMGSYAFYSCPRLTTASFPKCTYIGNYAFYNCASLTTALFPSCSSVYSSAFYMCYSLATISFPSCGYIGSYAFGRCSNLTTVSFPMCGLIEGYAFMNCSNLLSVYLLTSMVPNIFNTTLFNSTPISSSTGGIYGSIFVKASLLASFQTTTYWSVYSARMVGLTDAQIAALGT